MKTRIKTTFLIGLLFSLMFPPGVFAYASGNHLMTALSVFKNLRPKASEAPPVSGNPETVTPSGFPPSLPETSRQGFEQDFTNSHPESTPREPRWYLGLELHFLNFCIRSGIIYTDPFGLWSRIGVLKILCNTAKGKEIVSILNAIRVLKSEYVRSYLRKKESITADWGPWLPKEWGAMTTKMVGQKTAVHIPQSYADALAAFFLVHEGEHAGGGEELAAYRAETEFGLQAPEAAGYIRPGFVKSGKVDIEAIKKFISAKYVGWYDPDPLLQYKEDAQGRRIIEYGSETEEGPWCCDTK